jgi:hypothetical protein
VHALDEVAAIDLLDGAYRYPALARRQLVE